MNWDRCLWGVEWSGGMSGDKPTLLGSSWMKPMPKSQYTGEPTRVLLFCTREQARQWCRGKIAEYAGRGDCCERWKFRPVRVRETAVMISKEEYEFGKNRKDAA